MEIIATSAEIEHRIQEIAQELIREYKHTNPLFVCLLKGAVPFTAELMKTITLLDPEFHPDVEYMRTLAYGEGKETGEPRITVDLPAEIDISKRTVIILDDILDTGGTLEHVKRHLLSPPLGAQAVKLVVLVERESEAISSATIAGFRVKKGWVVGMGMNNDGVTQEAGRWNNYIYIQEEVAA